MYLYNYTKAKHVYGKSNLMRTTTDKRNATYKNLERVLIRTNATLPSPRMPKRNAIIILKSVVIRKKILKFKKSFPLVCRACRDESIDI